jgi:transcriptional regulator with XRE-family HTH domain
MSEQNGTVRHGCDIRPWPRVVEFLPPLSSAEREDLRRSIEQYGVQYPVLHLPDGRIIDGANRWDLTGGKAPTEVRDLPEDAAFALAIALNLARRQLSEEQKYEIHKRLRKDKEVQRQTALELRKQGKTQEEAAALVGVSQPTIARWEAGENGSIIHLNNVSARDCRIAIPQSAHAVIYERLQQEPAEVVASDYKVTPRRIRQLAQKEAHVRERDSAARFYATTVTTDDDQGIITADMSILWGRLEDDSVDMFFWRSAIRGRRGGFLCQPRGTSFEEAKAWRFGRGLRR